MVEPIYQPRNPKLSPLYQSILNHFAEFESLYEERYQRKYGVLRDVVREVVYKYLGCGDLRKGFARIKCKSCHHEVLLAFSCKGRYFCPSCHQKRVLMFGEWITEEILYSLPHRQYVFTIPKMLRPWILAITAHIPNKGEQSVRYYGYYSNVSRGKKLEPKEEEVIDQRS